MQICGYKFYLLFLLFDQGVRGPAGDAGAKGEIGRVVSFLFKLGCTFAAVMFMCLCYKLKGCFQFGADIYSIGLLGKMAVLFIT